MKNILLFLIIVLTGSSCFCQQKSRSSLTYSITHENDSINYLSATIAPYGEVGEQIRAGVSINAHLLLNKAFIELEGNYDIFSGPFDEKKLDGESMYYPVNANDFRLGGGYFFNKSVNRSVDVILETSPNHTVYGTFKAPFQKFSCIEGGIERGVRLINYEGLANVTDHYTNETASIDGNFTTNLLYYNIYFGGSIGKLYEIVGNFSGYGEKKKRSFHRFYLHALFMVKKELDDIYWVSSPAWSTVVTNRYNLNNTMPFSRIGLRMGYNVDDTGSAFSFRPEASILPDLKGKTNAVFRLRIGIGLNKVLNN